MNWREQRESKLACSLRSEREEKQENDSKNKISCQHFLKRKINLKPQDIVLLTFRFYKCGQKFEYIE